MEGSQIPAVTTALAGAVCSKALNLFQRQTKVWIFGPRKMRAISCVKAQGLKDPHELMSSRGESPQYSPAAAGGHPQKCSPVAPVMRMEVATGSPHFTSPSVFSGATKTADISQRSPEMKMTPWR